MRLGIIPADAGSTPFPHQEARQTRDHPRGCGEHESPDTHRPGSIGSSPRMRGAPQAQGAGKKIGRIIPADAGSTVLFILILHVVGDHPRGCGEH